MNNRHKASNSIYALKYINKERAVSIKAVANIIQERSLLETAAEAPFVCRLRYAFQDQEHLFSMFSSLLLIIRNI